MSETENGSSSNSTTSKFRVQPAVREKKRHPPISCSRKSSSGGEDAARGEEVELPPLHLLRVLSAGTRSDRKTASGRTATPTLLRNKQRPDSRVRTLSEHWSQCSVPEVSQSVSPLHLFSHWEHSRRRSTAQLCIWLKIMTNLIICTLPLPAHDDYFAVWMAV